MKFYEKLDIANNLMFTLDLDDQLQDDIRDYMLNTVNSI
jgi:hypothetical protein